MTRAPGAPPAGFALIERTNETTANLAFTPIWTLVVLHHLCGPHARGRNHGDAWLLEANKNKPLRSITRYLGVPLLLSRRRVLVGDVLITSEQANVADVLALIGWTRWRRSDLPTNGLPVL